jgi:hypothetical protein
MMDKMPTMKVRRVEILNWFMARLPTSMGDILMDWQARRQCHLQGKTGGHWVYCKNHHQPAKLLRKQLQKT